MGSGVKGLEVPQELSWKDRRQWSERRKLKKMISERMQLLVITRFKVAPGSGCPKSDKDPWQ